MIRDTFLQFNSSVVNDEKNILDSYLSIATILEDNIKSLDSTKEKIEEKKSFHHC